MSPKSTNPSVIARQALSLMDLTSLNDDDTDHVVEALCQRAKTPLGHTAAVCIYPQFVVPARRALTAHNLSGQVKIATVTNFPHGEDDVMAAARATREAVASGADEVDVVFPYRAFMNGDDQIGQELVEMCKAAASGRTLKVILETGELKDAELIRRASEQAIAGGADFLKTSTGKVAVNATPEAARVMLEVIRDADRPVGFKAAGGVRSVEDAAVYLELAAEIMGANWARPETFRFGASGLLDNLLMTAGVGVDGGGRSGGY
ncbi:deoxyribose-phosphate aldolase [Halomonas sp. DP1Y21-3]|uniref:deoxyribose-phosphate aldolase n=1 Tax=Halomonas sp. DP1Y21-3 TaxID=2859080 RepID=UPI001C96F6E9|nr:deoxyribose-phosphate aldolase [Halomonas sp. DP1Y21-3]MBY6108966.1 deoxyribose-phosphate aldolase [Halomonas sp. DP1Y21-3]